MDQSLALSRVGRTSFSSAEESRASSESHLSLEVRAGTEISGLEAALSAPPQAEPAPEAAPAEGWGEWMVRHLPSAGQVRAGAQLGGCALAGAFLGGTTSGLVLGAAVGMVLNSAAKAMNRDGSMQSLAAGAGMLFGGGLGVLVTIGAPSGDHTTDEVVLTCMECAAGWGMIVDAMFLAGSALDRTRTALRLQGG